MKAAGIKAAGIKAAGMRKRGQMGRGAAGGFSLEKRLMRRLSLIFLASFLVFTVVYLFFIQNDAVFHATEEVGELARDLGPTVVRQPDGSFAFARDAVLRRATWPAGTAYAAITLPGGAAVAGSDAALLGDLQDRTQAELSSAKVVDARDGLSVLGRERVVTPGGATVRIAVLRPMSFGSIARIGLTHEFAEEILPCFLPCLLLATLVAWLTIRRNLSPLRRASAEASAVSVDNPGQRMSTDNLATEIRPLIDTVNRALDRLEDALSLQRRFTANAAHELRTPLAVLRARADALPGGAARQDLTRDIDRMTRAVSQMLLTSRLQARAAGEMTEIDLAGLVRDVVADLAPLAHAKGRDIVLDVLGRPRIHGSEMALQSAARNLIENALRFTPPGEPVTVQVRAHGALVVEDCGPGIPDAERDCIFEPFWRASGQHAGEGAGLGLAIVSEVAALHGGSIAVGDAPGQGARFTLTLPLVGQPVAAPPAPDRRPRAPGPAPAPTPASPALVSSVGR